MTSRDIIRLLEQAGWYLVSVRGDHHSYKHPKRPALVTVTHPRKDFPIGTLKSMERASGLKFRK